MIRGILGLVLVCTVMLTSVSVAEAITFTSPNFSINGALGNSVAGQPGSTNYKMEASGGESIIGNGASGSYKLGQGYIASLERSIELNVQPGGQGLYVPFDEGTGTALYDNSTNVAQTIFVGTPQWTTGKIASAVTTDSTHYTGFSKTGAITPASAITLESWIKPSNLSSAASQKILSSTEAGGVALYLTGTSADLCSTTKICFAVRAGGVYQTVEVDKATYLSNGTWTHLTGSYNGSALKLYVNGVERATANVTGAISYHATAPLCIGAEAQTTTCSGTTFAGDLDEIKLFDRGLTAKEVEAEYVAQNAGIPAGLSLNSVTPGTSQTAVFDAAIQTDAPGYTLAISQNDNLTSGGNTIPGVSGSIASPVAWSEGTTKGLGFTLYGTNATVIPGIWNSGNNYAAMPGTSTAFYTRTGYTGGAKDMLNMRFRLDTTTNQAIGDYTNQMILVGTMIP